MGFGRAFPFPVGRDAPYNADMSSAEGQNALSSTLKICPICQTSHPTTAMVCRMCGASLAKIEPVARMTARRSNQDETAYDFRYGENDLIEQPLTRRGQTCFTIAITALLIYVKPLTSFFEFEQLNLPQLTICIGIGFVSVLWYELVKIITRRKSVA